MSFFYRPCNLLTALSPLRVPPHSWHRMAAEHHHFLPVIRHWGKPKFTLKRGEGAGT
jgi:hypothetical protein